MALLCEFVRRRRQSSAVDTGSVDRSRIAEQQRASCNMPLDAADDSTKPVRWRPCRVTKGQCLVADRVGEWVVATSLERCRKRRRPPP